MQLGMIGLGKMGGNMTERLMRDGHEVVVFDRGPETVERYVSLGATGSADAAALVAQLESPRVI